MTYGEMKKAEAELNLALAPQKHADGRWECMDFDSEDGHCCTHCGARYRREGVDHADDCPHTPRPQKKQRGASKAQLEHRAYMLKCCVWCGIPFSLHSVELTQECANARS